jgi:MFS family permease
MTLAQSLLPIVIFWAIVGGLGASLLLPSMQSLIHGNFQGAAQRRAYALVGAAAAIAAAVGPLVGGFITTYLSWRVAFGGEVVIIAIVLLGSGRVHDVPYTGERGIDVVGAILSALGMGGVVLGILVWQEGGEAVGALIGLGLGALALLVWWLRKRKREGKLALLDVNLFKSRYFRLGITGQTLQQISLGGMMIALPIYLQMVLELQRAAGRALTGAPLSEHVRGGAGGGPQGREHQPEQDHPRGLFLLALGVAILIPIVPRAHSGWWMVVPLLIAGTGLGLLVSQLNNYALSPIEEERVSAGAIMPVSLSLLFTHEANSSDVLSSRQATQVSKALEKNAEVITQAHLEALLVGQRPAVKAEILHINETARPRALQIALLVPLIASLIGLVNGFRMTRLPDPEPSSAAESLLGG